MMKDVGSGYGQRSQRERHRLSTNAPTPHTTTIDPPIELTVDILLVRLCGNAEIRERERESSPWKDVARLAATT